LLGVEPRNRLDVPIIVAHNTNGISTYILPTVVAEHFSGVSICAEGTRPAVVGSKVNKLLLGHDRC
jgi:hypothetical protein